MGLSLGLRRLDWARSATARGIVGLMHGRANTLLVAGGKLVLLAGRTRCKG